MAQSQYTAYESVQTMTADPVQIVFLLFDGATRFLRQAQDALGRGDFSAFAYKVSRAHAIISELSASLNPEIGGEASANLARLYDFMLRHLNEGLKKRSRMHLTAVLGLLREIREGFQGAAAATHHATA